MGSRQRIQPRRIPHLFMAPGLLVYPLRPTLLHLLG
jgi:hypothetical protein